jgi:hypothetical protein
MLVIGFISSALSPSFFRFGYSMSVKSYWQSADDYRGVFWHRVSERRIILPSYRNAPMVSSGPFLWMILALLAALRAKVMG